MKRRIVAFLLSVTLVVGLVFVSSSFVSAESEEEKARKDVERYISAVKEGDIDQIVEYSIDERDPNEDQRKEVLVRFLERNPVKRLEVLAFNFVGEKGSTVTISGQFGEETETATRSLVKENDRWLLLIED